jgi:hypothetical protein
VKKDLTIERNFVARKKHNWKSALKIIQLSELTVGQKETHHTPLWAPGSSPPSSQKQIILLTVVH